MAANPAAAGAAGIAAEAEEAGAGRPEVAPDPYPLDDMRAIFTMIAIPITQRDGTINAHNLMSMEVFD